MQFKKIARDKNVPDVYYREVEKSSSRNDHEENKDIVVRQTDASQSKLAMMVPADHALIAVAAVVHAWQLVDLALIAEAVLLNEVFWNGREVESVDHAFFLRDKVRDKAGVVLFTFTKNLKAGEGVVYPILLVLRQRRRTRQRQAKVGRELVDVANNKEHSFPVRVVQVRRRYDQEKVGSNLEEEFESCFPSKNKEETLFSFLLGSHLI